MLTQDIYDFGVQQATRILWSMVLCQTKPTSNLLPKSGMNIKRTGLDFADYDALAFHIPYTKMGKSLISKNLRPN